MTELNPTEKIPNLPPFSAWLASNIPAVYDNTMSYYDELTGLIAYIEQTVIPAVNTNQEALVQLQNLYLQLKEYVDHYFDNLDVQEEINNKIDSMVNNGTFQQILDGYVKPTLDALDAKIDDETEARETSDGQLRDLITQVGNGTPLVASSTAEMTDTTKVYVNTTNGKWYYYDGDSWEIGGDFQSAVIGENTIQPYMTKFLATKNLLPYTGWIEGKVWSWTNGSEMSYAAGCLHNTQISVTPGERLIIVNSNLLPTTDFTIVEYAEDDSFVKSTRCGYTLNMNLVIDENTSYIKFCSLVNKFSTLPINSIMIVRLSDVVDIINFNSIFDWKPGNRQSIKSEEIIISNPYGHKLLPRVYKNTAFTYSIDNYKLPNPYKAEITGTVAGNSATATVNLGNYVYANNVTTDDYLYVDYSDSSVKPTYVSIFADNGSSVGYMDRYDEDKGIFRLKLTNNAVTGLNNGTLWFFGYFYNQTVGESITVKVSTYINNDYSDIVKLISGKEEPAPIKMMFLGDSITHLSGDRSWTDKFNNIINGTTIANVAVDGARLRDFSETVYDGNPTQANPSSNVLGNQVQKIINNSYETPDAIIIAIGTNGGISVQGNELNDAFFTSSGVKPLADVDRKTDAGAYRWCTQKLSEIYPNAKIIWCTPIQSAYANAKRPSVVGEWGDNLKEFCLWGSTYCFDTEKCGINALNASTTLYDGLHPDIAGAQLMADYNAGEFNKLIDVIINKR